MVQYLWYLQMSIAPIPILDHQQSPVQKHDFLFSVNLLDIHVKQRSVSESSAPDFEYLTTHLITTAMILYGKGLCLQFWMEP